MTAIDQALVTDVVDAITDIYGAHPGVRAAHAKGMYCRGRFTPTAAAQQLSRAQHLQAPVDALIRFSNGSGDPAANDVSNDGRGMAVKFELPDGTTTDIVALTLPVFFVRTPEDFLAFTRARKPDPATGQPDAAAVGAYLAQHPEALPAVQYVLSSSPPASYAQLTYHGIHTFRFVNAGAVRRNVRYRWSPEAGEATLDPEAAKLRGRDHLRAEMRQRLADGPVGFVLSVAIAEAGDPLDDPTATWPEERERVSLGRLEISAAVDDPEEGGGVVVFDPTNVTDGIETSDDPILRVRRAAYSESVARRTR